MKTHSHLFVLHLGRRQSIGPARLHRMWKAACGSASIGVSRDSSVAAATEETTYLLAIYDAALHQHAEQQMRQMLETQGFYCRLRQSS